MIALTASYTAICTMAMWVAASCGGCPAPGTCAVGGFPNAAKACAFQFLTVSLPLGTVATAAALPVGKARTTNRSGRTIVERPRSMGRRRWFMKASLLGSRVIRWADRLDRHRQTPGRASNSLRHSTSLSPLSCYAQ